VQTKATYFTTVGGAFFTRLLYGTTTIYTRLHIFIQLSPTLMK